MVPIDAGFDANTLRNTPGHPYMYDETLSDIGLELAGCETMSMSMSQQQTAMSWRNDVQTSSLDFHQNNVYLPRPTVETDILHPISPSISLTGSSDGQGTPVHGVARVMDPIEFRVADPGSGYDCAASATSFGSSPGIEFAGLYHLSSCVDCFGCNSWALDTRAH